MKGKARSPDLLNEREQEIVQRLASGLSDQQIADELFLSLHTVKWYNRQIYSKLGVNSRMQAIACVKDLGLLESRDSQSPPTDSRMGGLPFPPNPFFLGREEEFGRMAVRTPVIHPFRHGSSTMKQGRRLFHRGEARAGRCMTLV